jgi:hypothetical protein
MYSEENDMRSSKRAYAPDPPGFFMKAPESSNSEFRKGIWTDIYIDMYRYIEKRISNYFTRSENTRTY